MFVRLWGMALFLFLHLSICLYLACDELCIGHTYPWEIVFSHYFFYPVAFLSALGKSEMRHPFDYANYTGLFAVLCYPFFVGLIAWEKRRALKLCWGIGIAYAWICIKASNCKGAYLSAILVTLYFLAVVFWHLRSKFSAKKLCVLSGIILLCIFALGYQSPKLKRVLTLLPKGEWKSLMSTRYYLAQDGFSIFLKKPWFGHGITTTCLHYLESHPSVVHHCWQLHVAPVQVLVEWGIMGLLGLGLLYFSTAYAAIKLLKNHDLATKTKSLLYGCLGTLLAYLTFVSEWSWDIFVVPCTLFCILGLIWDLYHETFVCKKTVSEDVCHSLFTSTFICLLILLGFFSCKDVNARKYFDLFLRDNGNEQFLTKALENDPTNLYYYRQAGNLFSLQAYPNDTLLFKKAIYYYERSLRINPNQPETLENLCALYARLGRVNHSIVMGCKAIELLPHHSLAFVQLIQILHHYGYIDLAKRWLSAELFLNPGSILAQEDFVKLIKDDNSIQTDCLAYYDQAEKNMLPADLNNSFLVLEKQLMARLFNKPFSGERCLKKEYFQNQNFLRLYSFDNLEKMNQHRRVYYDHYSYHRGHSSLQIILHGNGGPRLGITSFSKIYLPDERFIICDSDFNPDFSQADICNLEKQAHKILDALVQNTLVLVK